MHWITSANISISSYRSSWPVCNVAKPHKKLFHMAWNPYDQRVRKRLSGIGKTVIPIFGFLQFLSGKVFQTTASILAMRRPRRWSSWEHAPANRFVKSYFFGLFSLYEEKTFLCEIRQAPPPPLRSGQLTSVERWITFWGSSSKTLTSMFKKTNIA